MATRVYLHVGAPKSGTTYVQSILWANREMLRADGVLYPGEHYRSHTHAALDLQGRRFMGHEDPLVPGAWQRMADQATAWDGTVVVSQELLSPARPEHVERALASLAPAEVHIVFTARDLARQVPAAWQEDLKNQRVLRFDEFVAGLRTGGHPSGPAFWRMQDAAGVLARWAKGIPPERVHLITIPRRRAPDTLWTRFCAVTGLDPGRYDTSAAAVNSSLGIGEANLLRRLNLALGDRLRWPDYNDLVTGLVGIDVLASRPVHRRIALTGTDRAWIAGKAAAMVEELRAAGYGVVGDLDDLIPAADTAQRDAPDDPDDPDEAEMLGAAMDCMVSLLTRLQADRDEFDRVGRELRAGLDAASAERDRLRAEAEELRTVLAKPAAKLFVRRLSEKHRSVMRVRIIYWNVVEALRRVRSKVSAQRSGDTSSGSAAR